MATRTPTRAAGETDLPPLVEGVTSGRYDSTIAKMRAVLARKEQERMQTSEQWLIDALDPEIDNLRSAIDLFSEANGVAAETIQFGGSSYRSTVVSIPPSIKEFRFPPIRFQRYVYVTREPVELLLLRRMVANPARFGDLREMTVGLQAAVSKDGKVIGFYPEEMMRDLHHAHVLQSNMQIG